MKLLAFPCSRELVAPFCEKLGTTQSAALILKKQEHSLKDVLSYCGIRDVYVLSEDLYGKVSSHETRGTLTEIRQRGFTHAYFPLNDFCGNVALLMAVLVPEVIAINASSVDQVEVRLSCTDMDWATVDRPDAAIVSQAQSGIVQRLKAFTTRIEAMASGERAGEKPSLGLLANFPYDCEILSRYVDASKQVQGRVLEIGCGLGYGAYLMVKLNPTIRVRAVDNDSQVVELAKELWGENDQLTFDVVQAEDLPFQGSSFDSVVCFEVIEHLRQPELLLKEVRRILTGGGRIVGSTPNCRLFPYRVNKDLPGTPEELRQQGVWPWHLQDLNEAAILALMERFGFCSLSIKYPTFTTGIDLYDIMRRSPFPVAIEHLSNFKWSAADFAILDSYYPCFSGFSFLFSGVVKGETGNSSKALEVGS